MGPLEGVPWSGCPGGHPVRGSPRGCRVLGIGWDAHCLCPGGMCWNVWRGFGLAFAGNWLPCHGLCKAWPARMGWAWPGLRMFSAEHS
jgi:hypothetical protein